MIKEDMMILAKDQYFSLNCMETLRNNNVLVVGTCGAGKTRGIVAPNLLQATGSYIVSDPKGNLYRKYGSYLRSKGYRVQCLDFVHPERSAHYNCLKYVHNSHDIVKLATMLVYQRKIASLQDPFWEEAATMLLSALIGYLVENKTLSDDDRNLQSILKLIRVGRRGDYNNEGKTVLEKIMDEFGKNNPKSWAYTQFQNANVAANKTFDSILITLTSKLGIFDTEELRKMMRDDELNIASIGQKKTALFVVVSDTDRSMDALANLFFTQAMNELCLYADEKCRDNCLPVPVRFLLDDFATNCRIEEFPRMIASIRSRGISTMLMIQAESQLTEGYGHDGRTIIGNCDTYIYLGGNDLDTAKAVAERCDLPFNKVLTMPVGRNWIFRRGEEPVFGYNFDLNTFLEEKGVVEEDLSAPDDEFWQELLAGMEPEDEASETEGDASDWINIPCA